VREWLSVGVATRRYGIFILVVELLGVISMLPYGIINVHGTYSKKPGSTGLPAAHRSTPGTKYK
jgi:hypothetical protein